MPQRSASACVASDVATVDDRKPDRTRSPKSSTKCFAVEPGAKPEPHRRAHHFESPRRSGLFLRIGCHRMRFGWWKTMASAAQRKSLSSVVLPPWIAGIPNSRLRAAICPLSRGPTSVSAPPMPSVLPAPTIVFDLDGTLVDTAPDLIDTLNFVLAKDGLPPVPYATARMLIGGGAKPMIARGLKAEGRTASPETIDRMFKDFIAYYGEHIADRSRPFPGLEATLDHFAGRGFILAVCTNKLENLSVQLLKALRLDTRFAAICGQDTFRIQKPDPDHSAPHDRSGRRQRPTRSHGRGFGNRHSHCPRRRYSNHRSRFWLQRPHRSPSSGQTG